LRRRHNDAIVAGESGDFNQMDLFAGELDRDLPLMAADAVGRALRSARERLGLSLIDVAGQTRMAVCHLEAIELARFDGFAAPVYALGFARNYAGAVGVSRQWVVDSLREEVFAAFDTRKRFDLGWSAEGMRKNR
jgi:transcriptional regulator with XRE-family HTH domain